MRSQAASRYFIRRILPPISRSHDQTRIPGYSSHYVDTLVFAYMHEQFIYLRSRWVTGAEASMCFVNDHPRTAALTFHATSFYKERHLELYAGERQLLSVTVPADGLFHAVSTPPVEWSAGPTLLRLYVPEGSTSPMELGPSEDPRELSIGINDVRFSEVGAAGSK